MLAEVRESYVGKFDAPITAYVYDRVVLAGFSDESVSSWTGDWADLVGKRVVAGDDRGFVWSERFATVKAARDYFAQVESELLGDDDD